jgi:virginiamycin A acetyltransferase
MLPFSCDAIEQLISCIPPPKFDASAPKSIGRSNVNTLTYGCVTPSWTLYRVKSVLKALSIGLGAVIAAVPALTCKIEQWVTDGDPFFLFWGQLFALFPGLPGIYLRKSYYFLTLRRCSLDSHIGFLSIIHDRRTQIGNRVYIGTAVGIGWATVGAGCLLASRVSILSGHAQHQIGPDGRLTPFDRRSAKQTHIGEATWIGEGAIIMADVQSRCIVGAGSIVTKPVASGSLVAGNPARLIRKLVEGPYGRPSSVDASPSPQH